MKFPVIVLLISLLLILLFSPSGVSGDLSNKRNESLCSFHLLEKPDTYTGTWKISNEPDSVSCQKKNPGITSDTSTSMNCDSIITDSIHKSIPVPKVPKILVGSNGQIYIISSKDTIS